MSNEKLAVPFMWPDSRKLAGVPGPLPDRDAILRQSQLILAVVHSLSEDSVERLRALSAGEIPPGGDGRAADATPTRVRLIVVLYPACPTRTENLAGLLHLQQAHANLEVRIVTCGLLAGPQNTVACYPRADALPIVLFGSAAGFEDLDCESVNATLAFTPEPVLAAEWAKWFDVRWLCAVPLTPARTTIPHLVLPTGTSEGAQKWEEYERMCGLKQPDDNTVAVTVDPSTGEVSASAADGTPVPTITTENNIPKVSPTYRRLAQLLEKGHLVSVDKSTRLLPLEVPVKPKWFGLETETQIGAVRRKVSYHISALTADELKQLENRRKKTAELLEVFSFSLADGQRWMPGSTEALFQQESNRVNAEAKGILVKLVGGNLAAFLKARRATVKEDAERMLRDLFPDRQLSEGALDEIMQDLKKRFEQPTHRSFLPQLSFCRVGLSQPQDAAWKSQLGSAFHLLLSIVRYPRRACQNGPYFARGMSAKPLQILKAMNVLDDRFVANFDGPDAKAQAEAELNECEEIEVSDGNTEQKCERLFALLERSDRSRQLAETER